MLKEKVVVLGIVNVDEGALAGKEFGHFKELSNGKPGLRLCKAVKFLGGGFPSVPRKSFRAHCYSRSVGQGQATP